MSRFELAGAARFRPDEGEGASVAFGGGGSGGGAIWTREKKDVTKPFRIDATFAWRDDDDDDGGGGGGGGEFAIVLQARAVLFSHACPSG